MALGATAAKLLASLDLDTKPFERGIGKVNQNLGGLEKRFGTVGKVAAVGIGAAAGVGLVALGGGIRAGIESLDQLENATTAVDGAINQMGLTGQLTATQVHDWANQIEKDVGAAFDDKAITQAATTLIRFGKITPQNLQPALVVMTDLATKTGSVDSAASLLAKALADPEKAAGKLARSGVVLTKQQQAQIKAMVKAGDSAGAQAFLLDQLSKATTGAALASQGPYARSLSVLKDVTEDAQRALGEGFLPVIIKVRDILTRELGKPGTINTLRDFGKGLAGGLDQLVNVASGLPWGSIGDAFKLVGQGSKAALDLFTGLPPWIQTAVLTGWGLNKLTGGALGTIVGSLGSGLIKGVLGMTAGVVNAKAGVVNVVGGAGIPGGAPAGGVVGAAKGGISTLGKVFLIGEAIGLVAAVNEVRDNIAAGLTKQSTDIHAAVSAQINATKPDIAALAQSMAGVDQGIEALSHDPIGNALLGDQLGELQKIRGELSAKLVALDDRAKAAFRISERADADVKQQAAKAQAIAKELDTKTARLNTRIEDVGAKTDRLKQSAVSAIGNTTNKVGDLQRTTSSGTDRIVAAIHAIKLDNSVTVFVDKGDAGNRYTSNGTASTGGRTGGGGRKP